MKANKEFIKWLKSQPDGRGHLIETETEFTYEDYKEWCRQNGITPAPYASEPFYSWCSEQSQINFEDDLDNILHSWVAKQGGFLVTGTIGRWNGRFGIVPFIETDFRAVIDRLGGGDILSLTATYDKDAIHIKASHHDSDNLFDVYIIKKGVRLEALTEAIEDGWFNLSIPPFKGALEKITDFI